MHFGAAANAHGFAPLDKKTWLEALPVDQLLDDPSASLPLAGRIDFERMGYVQLNFYPSRSFVPTLLGPAQTQMRQVGATLEVLRKEQVIANYVQWMQAGVLCGRGRWVVPVVQPWCRAERPIVSIRSLKGRLLGQSISGKCAGFNGATRKTRSTKAWRAAPSSFN